MKATLANHTLFWISGKLMNRDPLWAILTANEYLDTSDALRTALAARARGLIGKAAPAKLAVAKRILECGVQLHQLSDNEVAQLAPADSSSGRHVQRTLPSAGSLRKHRTLRRTESQSRRPAPLRATNYYTGIPISLRSWIRRS